MSENEEKKADNLRILVVDDNKDIHADYKKILIKAETKSDTSGLRGLLFAQKEVPEKDTNRGTFGTYQIDSAYQGLEAVDMVRSAQDKGVPYAMAYVDCRMPPGIDGIETIQKIWAIDPDLQVVFCTAFTDYNLEEIHEKLGITDRLLIIKKPFEPIVIKQTTASLITKWNTLLRKNIAEKKIVLLHDILKNIINSMPAILISVDPQGNITQWNNQAEMATGILEKAAMGKPVSEVFPFLEAHVSEIKQVVKSGNVYHYSGKMESINELNGKKKIRYKDISICPLSSAGSTAGAVTLINDVTELKKKEQQLIQIQKMETIGTLAGGLAHDFNNLLSGIVGSISIMEFKLFNNKPLPPEKIKQYLQTMKKSSQKATDIVKQLMSLARKEKEDVSFVSVNLDKSLKNILRVCESTFDARVVIDAKFPDESIIIFANSTQIEQVLLNLCINAQHAMTLMRSHEELWGGTLSITIKKADSTFGMKHPLAENQPYGCITISDSGIGMDQDTVEKIFDPFFTTKEKGTGTGLGMTMVQKILTDHKGFIEVSSEVGVGTTFDLFIPMQDSASSQACD